jgi:hypothetical protein
MTLISNELIEDRSAKSTAENIHRELEEVRNLSSMHEIRSKRFRRILYASTIAFSIVIAGLCSFVIVASLAAWSMLNQ